VTFQLTADRAGLRRFSPHVLRHTLAKWLRTGGVDSATTGALLGHADGRMVERIYGRLDRAEDARSAVVAQYMGELFLYGNGGAGGAPRRLANRRGDKSRGFRGRCRAQGRNRTADTGIFSPSV
jgi:hypothetical protein